MTTAQVSDIFQIMGGDLNEPKKETVRITLPTRPDAKPAAENERGSDTVRINLPTRPPAATSPEAASAPSRPPAPPKYSPPRPAPASGAKPAAPPPLRAPLSPAGNAAKPAFRPPAFRPPSGTPTPAPIARPENLPPPSAPYSQPTESATENYGASAGPKKETARINLMPEKSTPAVNMTKTQPLRIAPVAAVQTMPVNVVDSEEEEADEFIPKPLTWGLLGASALIFVIQLWNYLAI